MPVPISGKERNGRPRNSVSIALAERTGRFEPKPGAADAVQALDHVVINTPNPDRALAL